MNTPVAPVASGRRTPVATERPPVMTSWKPWMTNSVASVASRSGIPNRTISSALSDADEEPADEGDRDRRRRSSRKITRLIADSIIARPAFAPTERSKPATTRLIVTAQAMIVTIEMPRRMANAVRDRGERRLGQREERDQRRRSARTASSAGPRARRPSCRRLRRRPPRGARGAHRRSARASRIGAVVHDRAVVEHDDPVGELEQLVDVGARRRASPGPRGSPAGGGRCRPARRGRRPGTARRGAAAAPARASQRPTTTFCWLPPESERSGAAGPAATMPRSPIAAWHAASLGAWVEEPAPADQPQERQAQVGRDRPVGQRRPARPGPRGRGGRRGRSPRAGIAGGERAPPSAPRRRRTAGRRTAPRAARRLAGPDEPEQPDDLALATTRSAGRRLARVRTLRGRGPAAAVGGHEVRCARCRERVVDARARPPTRGVGGAGAPSEDRAPISRAEVVPLNSRTRRPSRSTPTRAARPATSGRRCET